MTLVSKSLQITQHEVRWYRLRASGLVEPFASLEEASSALAGVQAQILQAAGLSLWNRVAATAEEMPFDDDGFQDALWKERRLVKLWSQRGTLHLFPANDWSLVVGALSGKRSWWERKWLEKRGTSEEFHHMIETLVALMKERGILSRSLLRETELPLDGFLLSSWGGIFHELVRRGEACHAPRAGSEGRFAHRTHWLPDLAWEPPTYEEANQELVRRYFLTYGPSTIRDFAYWRGMSLRDVRPWVEAVADELCEVSVEGDTQWLHRDGLPLLADSVPDKEEWPLLMLYRFDPLLLGHKDKSWLVSKENHSRVWRKAGHIEGTILQEGRITGTWRYHRSGSVCNVTIEPFGDFAEDVEDALMNKAVDIATYFGCECKEVHFVEGHL